VGEPIYPRAKPHGPLANFGPLIGIRNLVRRSRAPVAASTPPGSEAFYPSVRPGNRTAGSLIWCRSSPQHRTEGAMAGRMTNEEREAFLAEVHVGIVAVEDPGRSPLAVPVWYLYETGGTVRIMTGPTSRKAQLIERTGRLSLVVQTETPPYKYVSIQGSATILGASDEEDRRTVARRYLGREGGDAFLNATADPPPRHQSLHRSPGLFLRSPQPLAARIKREHQWASSPIPAERHRSFGSQRQGSGQDRSAAQRPASQDARIHETI
jgi:hypothetical protein